MLDAIGLRVAQPPAVDVIRRDAVGPVTLPDALMRSAAPDEALAPPVRKLSERWYTIQHKPFEGARARIAIRRAGFEVHWPRQIVRRHRRDDVLEPLFPGYLFARFDVARRGWGGIQRADHVVGILGLREVGAPIPVAVGEVERLIERAGAIDLPIDSTGDDRFHVLVEPIKPGTPLTLLDERLFGQPAILKADRGGDRVKVLLQMLGCDRVVELARASVRVAQP